MRDIKFRAWNKKHNEMWEVTSMSWVIPRSYNEPERDTSDTVQSIGAGNKDSTNELHPDNTLMQYTGLKDKNGVEIYEGDIFKSSNEVGSIQGVVKFQDGAFVATHAYLEVSPNLGDIKSMTSVEVIGNVHENPELLKENK